MRDQHEEQRRMLAGLPQAAKTLAAATVGLVLLTSPAARAAETASFLEYWPTPNVGFFAGAADNTFYVHILWNDFDTIDHVSFDYGWLGQPGLFDLTLGPAWVEVGDTSDAVYEFTRNDSLGAAFSDIDRFQNGGWAIDVDPGYEVLTLAFDYDHAALEAFYGAPGLPTVEAMAPYAITMAFNSGLSVFDGPNGTLNAWSLGFNAAGYVENHYVPPAPGVPEPASWLMMLMGFGTAAAARRRRREPRAPAQAQ